MPLRSPNGGKFFPPPSPPVDPCAFGLCSGSATATDLAPRACTPTNRRSKAVVTAPAAPATNPSLLHWIHASFSCRTHQSCPSMFHWVHAFSSCRIHQSHHEVLFLDAFVVQEYGILSFTARASAAPSCTPPISCILSSFLRSSLSNISRSALHTPRFLTACRWVPPASCLGRRELGLTGTRRRKRWRRPSARRSTRVVLPQRGATRPADQITPSRAEQPRPMGIRHSGVAERTNRAHTRAKQPTSARAVE